ncbi:MAG: hypothetical protein KIT79_05375 [Deltaproteobacteria bacterium]|nr:hypothetical protein [Deltaproteobacteria bacterium]
MTLAVLLTASGDAGAQPARKKNTAVTPAPAETGGKPEPVPAETVPPFTRFYEPVILNGKTLPGFMGKSIRSFRVGVAAGDGVSLKPIPFQVDERNERNGAFVYSLGPGADFRDETPGIFDENDEIVFLARDAGSRLSAGARENLGAGVIEATLIDQRNGSRMWAYLFPHSDMLPLSDIKRVKLDDPDEGLRVTAEGYGFRLARDCQLTFDYLAVRDGAIPEVNIMDRLKVRGWVKLFGLISIKTNECDWTSRYHAAVDGPVRVIRRTKNSYTITVVPTVRFDTELVFYPHHFEVAITGRLPFDLRRVAPSGGFGVYVDYNDAVKGAQFYTGAYTEGVTFDGTPKTEPTPEVLGRVPYVWSALYGVGPGRNLGWFSRVVPGFNVPTKYAPQINDDDRAANPPESYPGVHEIGFKVDSLDEMQGGRFAISSVLYRTKDWSPADVQSLLDVVDKPLLVELSPADGVSVPVTRFTLSTRPNEPPLPAEADGTDGTPAGKGSK